jgi:hypothetical protein
VGAIGIAAFAARDWYYGRYVWPLEIQKEVLGGVLAPSSSLIEYKSSTHYADGTFRWRFKVEPGSKMLASLCDAQPIERCVFSKARIISEDVNRIVSYEAGILTVEENWS